MSEIVRPRPDPGVVAWLKKAEADERNLFLSAVTVAELRWGALILPTGDHRRGPLLRWLEQDLLGRFMGRILSFDTGVAMTWAAAISAVPRSRHVPAFNSLIAATAIHHHLTMATRNVHDMSVFPGLHIENPFSST